MTPDNGSSRRRFFVVCFGLCNAITAGLLGVPAVGYLLGPLLRRVGSRWVSLGPVSQFRSSLPRKTEFQTEDDVGFTSHTVHRTVFVRRADSELIVLSPICTHMGCNVAFDPESSTFECPCHGGRYDTSGRVISGPPPRPLERFKTRESDGNLEINVT